MNDDETMVEYLRRLSLDKKFVCKKEVKVTVDIVDDIRYESEETIWHLMSEVLEPTFTLKFGDLIFENCSFMISKDGKRMEWFNDERSGVIEVK